MDNGLIVSNGHPQQRGPHHLGSSTLTLRSNQLAALDDMDANNRDGGSLADYDYDVEYDEDIYQEASTLPINNSTMRTRNRRVSDSST